MKVKLVLFQKNEHILLEDWLLYHGSIFGMDSIHVINHQPDKKTIDIVNKLGVSYNNFNDSFKNKHIELTRILNNYKSKVDILIPIDCDEFFCYSLSHKNKQYSTDKDLILKELFSLRKDVRYKVAELRAYAPKQNYKDPLIEICKFKRHTKIHKNSKTFYPAPYFLRTDQGNHHGKITTKHFPVDRDKKQKKGWTRTNLCYMHFHIMGYNHFISKMTKGMMSYGNDTSGGHHYNFFGQQIIEINKDQNLTSIQKDKAIKKIWNEYIDCSDVKRATISSFIDKIKELRKSRL